MNDFKRGLIGRDVIERKDGVDDLPPLMVVSGQDGQFQPFLEAGDDVIRLVGSLVEDELCLGRLSLRFSFVEEGIELISSGIVSDPKVIKDVSYSQRSTHQQHTRLFTIFEEIRAHGTMVHKHVLCREELLSKDIVHFLYFQRLELSSSIRQARQWYALFPQFSHRFQSAWDRSMPSKEHPINVSDDDRLEDPSAVDHSLPNVL